MTDYFDADMRRDIVAELERDNALAFPQKQSGKYFRNGTCPSCSRKDAYINIEQPGAVKCGSEGKGCGSVFPVSELFPWLFENLSERYPATNENPNATADKYLSARRGFDIEKLKGWYEQGRFKLPSGTWTDTVRFYLDNEKAFYWERLINASALKEINPKTGKNVPKAHFKFGYLYNDGKYWEPQGQTIEKGDTVYIVEGIFHAIAFYLAGYKVVSAFTCGNLPTQFIDKHIDNSITWGLAYDDEPAARKAMLKYMPKLDELDQKYDVYLTGSKGVDWDQAFNQGRLDDQYLSECCFRGDLFRAESPKEWAFNWWKNRKSQYKVFDFNNRLHTYKINTKALDDLYREHDDPHYEPELHEFTNCTDITEISNCYPQFLYIERDELTKDQKYFFNVDFSDNRPTCQAALEPSAVNDPRNFSNALLNKSAGGLFEGSAADMRYLRKQWLNNNVDFVESIDFVGYHKDSKAWIFPEFAMHNGQVIPINDQGYFSVGERRLKTSLKSVSINLAEVKTHDWYDDFYTCFGPNGLATLSFFTASLFARQIKVKMGGFGFLEVTGEKEAGKSTLIRFIWKLLGRENYEGFDILEASAAGRKRSLAQLSNLPMVLVESDREQIDAEGRSTTKNKGFEWDMFKKVYDLDGVIANRGVNNGGNDTKDPIFQGTLVITQNATVTGSEALMSRIVHLHCTTAHKKAENIPKADRLKQMSANDIGGYLVDAIKQENAFLSTFFEQVDKYRDNIRHDAQIQSERIIDTHAQVMAAVHALGCILPVSDEQKGQLYQHLVERAKDRQSRLNSDHPMIEQFWDVYHYINNQTMEIHDQEGHRVVPVEKLNHSADKQIIALNLNQIEEAARNRGQKLAPISLLKEHLQKSQRHQFVSKGKGYSKLEKRSLHLWKFIK